MSDLPHKMVDRAITAAVNEYMTYRSEAAVGRLSAVLEAAGMREALACVEMLRDALFTLDAIGRNSMLRENIRGVLAAFDALGLGDDDGRA